MSVAYILYFHLKDFGTSGFVSKICFITEQFEHEKLLATLSKFNTS